MLHNLGMDEPTHSNESQFWDLVDDWLLGLHDREHGVLGAAEMAALRSGIAQGQQPL